MLDKFKYRRSPGFTLVEVLIGTGIMIIGMAAIYMEIIKARTIAENSIIKVIASSYAEGLVEYISRLPYGDVNPMDHDFVDDPISAFKPAKSGIIDSTGKLNPILSENQIGFKIPVPGFPIDATSKTPFLLPATSPEEFTYPQAPENLLGFERSDFPGNNTGNYTLEKKKYQMQLVGVTNKSNLYSSNNAKYFYADDVDDFNGFTEVIPDIMPGITLTLKVAVQAITPPDKTSIEIEVSGQKYTLSDITPLQDIGPLSATRLISGITIQGIHYPPVTPRIENDVAGRTTARKIASLILYGDPADNPINTKPSILLKKITVTAEWIYPSDSNLPQSHYCEAYYSGKCNTGVNIS